MEKISEYYYYLFGLRLNNNWNSDNKKRFIHECSTSHDWEHPPRLSFHHSTECTGKICCTHFNCCWIWNLNKILQSIQFSANNCTPNTLVRTTARQKKIADIRLNKQTHHYRSLDVPSAWKEIRQSRKERIRIDSAVVRNVRWFLFIHVDYSGRFAVIWTTPSSIVNGESHATKRDHKWSAKQKYTEIKHAKHTRTQWLYFGIESNAS